MAILVLSVKGQKIVLKNAENPWFLKGFRGEVLKWDLIMEATTRFELVIRVLQTHALPLGYVAILNWSGWRGSNSLPPPWQGGALPDELHPHKKWMSREDDSSMVPPVGIEPTTRGFSVLCSTNWATEANKKWRPGTGSNRRPLAWQASVLTN